VQPWTARLRYAYADALLAAGREAEAREWFAKAVEADRDGSTDASDRLAALDGVEFTDALAEDGEDHTESPRADVGDQDEADQNEADQDYEDKDYEDKDKDKDDEDEKDRAGDRG
jgi:hypothetical protein